MARRGDGVYQRGDTWWLDFTHDGRRHYVRLGRRAGVKGVTPHTLRHTLASRLVMAGVDLRTVQELGGWSSLDLVQRYAHLSATHKAEAVERVAAHSPTVFTTPLRPEAAVSGKLLTLKSAPVAQVDRAAVS
jgi:integrase